MILQLTNKSLIEDLRSRLGGALFACSCALTACASSNGATPTDAGNGHQDATTSDPDAAPNDASAPQDAGGGGSFCSAPAADGGACNGLSTSLGPKVAFACANGGLPAGTGGTLVDGTYELTRLVDYSSGCDDAGTSDYVRGLMTVAAGCIQGVQSVNATQRITRTTFTMAISGNSLSITEVCPEAAPAQVATFTATDSSLTIFDPVTANVSYYTKM